MPVPKQRKSKSKRDMRRSNHDKLAPPTLVACGHCGEFTRPHHVCPACGFYKARSVIEIREEDAGDETAKS
jgi:large subunit ribosomal protein L32